MEAIVLGMVLIGGGFVLFAFLMACVAILIMAEDMKN